MINSRMAELAMSITMMNTVIITTMNTSIIITTTTMGRRGSSMFREL